MPFIPDDQPSVGFTPDPSTGTGFVPDTPGSHPDAPLPEQGVTKAEREKIKYFGQQFGNQAVIEWLQRPAAEKGVAGTSMGLSPLELGKAAFAGPALPAQLLAGAITGTKMAEEMRQYDAVENVHGQISVRPKGTTEPWRVIDPEGLDWGDVGDIAPDLAIAGGPGGTAVRTAASLAGADVAMQTADKAGELFGLGKGFEAPLGERVLSPVISGTAGAVTHGAFRAGGAGIRQLAGRGNWYAGAGQRPSFRVSTEGRVTPAPAAPRPPQPEVRPPWQGAPDVPTIMPEEAAAARGAPDEYLRQLTLEQAAKEARYQELSRTLSPASIAEMKALAPEIAAGRANLNRLAGRPEAPPKVAPPPPKTTAAPLESPATPPWEAAPDVPPMPKAPSPEAPTGNPELDDLLTWQRKLQTEIGQGKDFSPEELAQVPKKLLRIQQIRSGKSTAPPPKPVEPDDELVAKLKARMATAKNWSNQSLEDATQKWDVEKKAHIEKGLPVPEHSIPKIVKLPGAAFVPEKMDLHAFDEDFLRQRAIMAGIPKVRGLPRDQLEEQVKRHWNRFSDVQIETRVKGWELTNSAKDQPFEAKFFERTKTEKGTEGKGVFNSPRRGLFALAPPVGSTREISREVIVENFADVSDDNLARFAAQIVPKREGLTQKASTFASRLAKLKKKDRDGVIDFIWKEGWQALQGKGMNYDPKIFGNRTVYDLENDSWRSLPLDWMTSFRKPGGQEVDLLARKSVQVPGWRGKAGRGLMEMGGKLRAPADLISRKIQGISKEAVEMDPMMRYSLRRTLGASPIYGATIGTGLLLNIPSATYAGAALAGTQVVGGGMRALGRAIQYDTGGIVSRLFHAKDPGVARTARALQKVLQTEGLKAYRDLLLAQIVLDPAFRAAVEGNQ